MKVATQTRIPQASDESIIKYQTKWSSCNCPDFAHRGGSYDLGNNETGCKHMARQRSENKLVGTAYRQARYAFENKNNPVQIAAPKIDATIAWVSFLELDPPAIDFEDPFAAFN